MKNFEKYSTYDNTETFATNCTTPLKINKLCDHEFKNNGKGAEICIKCGLPYAINC